ncbi:hypothetical protein [Clostridium cibarium]|uniref:HEAT repeat domain-containing protein n=1 Tax=Clostridium cibarium TaxID=2762247 RepID=A0ABR8PUE4_9CLOT|nr:hypothetical protein [Clostridium cibarium]MBD7911794.1 hypothetical protein [Clostridium cibarium]
MEEDYEYLKSKNLEELLKVIDDFNDMDETVEVIDILSDINSEKALEKGINFLWNNAGDEYFQAMIIDIIDDIDFHKVLDCLTHRKDDIQAYLLGELMNEMVIHSSDKCVIKYIDLINNQYTLINEKEKKRIDEKYRKFVKEFKIKNK